MSIRILARDLYRYQQIVTQLEKELASASAAKRPRIEVQLRQAKAERETLRRALDGHIGR